MTSAPKPKYSSQISFGNILTIVFGVVTAVGMFFMMEARSQANLDDIREIKTDISKFEERIRDVETEQARADERFGSILNLLAKIDTRLERIEARK